MYVCVGLSAYAGTIAGASRSFLEILAQRKDIQAGLRELKTLHGFTARSLPDTGCNSYENVMQSKWARLTYKTLFY